MVQEYSKMKPKTFTKHLQAILTTYYEEIKSTPGASGCPKPKFLTRKLVIEDEDTRPMTSTAPPRASAAAAAALRRRRRRRQRRSSRRGSTRPGP